MHFLFLIPLGFFQNTSRIAIFHCPRHPTWPGAAVLSLQVCRSLCWFPSLTLAHLGGLLDPEVE